MPSSNLDSAVEKLAMRGMDRMTVRKNLKKCDEDFIEEINKRL